MKNIRSALLLMGLALLATASCGDDQLAKDMELLADAACACGDQECAEAKLEEFEAFVAKNKEKKVSKSAAESLQKATEKATNCMIEKGVAAADIAAAVE